MKAGTGALAGVLAAALLSLPAPAPALVGGLPAVPTRSAEQSVPVPEDDPFYAVPRDAAAHRNGDVLDSRRIEAKVYDLPVPADAWQVKYRTEDSKDRPSATVTTLLVPRLPWLGAGPRPVVSYQTAEDGVAGKCAPSYALRAGARGGFSGSYSETGLIGLLVARGWAVAVPDYEGPRSEFLVGDTQAKGVLDGVRALKRFRTAGLGRSPVALWGYSGGSLASVTAAQLQPTYAPELRFAGVALGGLLGDVRATIDAFSGSAFGGAIPMGINGFLRAYPELRLLQYLTERGRALVEEASGDCITDAVPRHPFLSLADLEATPHALSTPAVAEMLRDNSPLHRGGTPQAPIYHYHAVLDELAPIAPARATLRRFCAAGAVVQSVENPVGEHLTEVVVGAPGAIAFLQRRFSGRTPVDTCGSIPQ